MLEPCSLSSACLVSCWSVVFGSRHSCLKFRFRVGVRTLLLHVLSRFVSMQSRVRSAACSSVDVSCVLCCTQFVFYQAACIHVMSCAVWHAACVYSLAPCFHVGNSCVNMWLMSFLISCRVHVLFCTWLVICFLAMCLCFCFV